MCDHVPKKSVEDIDQHEVIHEIYFVFCQNPKSQELLVTPDEVHSPEHLRSLLLKLPQQPHSIVHVVHCELSLVLAHYIKHMVFSRAHLQLLQHLVSGHRPSMKEPTEAGVHRSEAKHHRRLGLSSSLYLCPLL